MLSFTDAGLQNTKPCYKKSRSERKFSSLFKADVHGVEFPPNCTSP